MRYAITTLAIPNETRVEFSFILNKLLMTLRPDTQALQKPHVYARIGWLNARRFLSTSAGMP